VNPKPVIDRPQVAAQRLRILHIDTDDLENPLRGGQPVRTFAINSRLAARHSITVFTAVYPKCRRRQSRAGVFYRRLGFQLPPFGLSPHLSFLASVGPTVARTPHDLVVEEFTPPVGFCGIPWWTRKPVVLVAQWYFFEQWERRYRMPFRRWMRRVASKDRYRYLITQSEAMSREFRQFLPDATIRCIPSGVEDTAFTETSSLGEYVLFLGRLDIDHKGLDLLIEAWRQVCGKSGVPLVIAGEGPGRTVLEKAIADSKLGSLVKLIGRVEGAAKSRALVGSRILAMPSRYETFGITALEAMAAAKPVVCFDIDHLNELAMPPWAVQVPKFDPYAFAGAIVELWNDPDRCQAMGSHARQRATEYRWDDIARRQEEFFLEIATSGSLCETT
jgi:glycosyltransferase involved in cell wall biosynthesis